MTEQPNPAEEQLLAIFKALADANRLKIISLLAAQPYTVEQLASLLDLRPSTISHHLARLSEAGLVSAASYYNSITGTEHLERRRTLLTRGAAQFRQQCGHRCFRPQGAA
jgi:DNA-binding transcriptional ArsR family regulator